MNPWIEKTPTIIDGDSGALYQRALMIKSTKAKILGLHLLFEIETKIY